MTLTFLPASGAGQEGPHSPEYRLVRQRFRSLAKTPRLPTYPLPGKGRARPPRLTTPACENRAQETARPHRRRERPQSQRSPRPAVRQAGWTRRALARTHAAHRERTDREKGRGQADPPPWPLRRDSLPLCGHHGPPFASPAKEPRFRLHPPTYPPPCFAKGGQAARLPLETFQPSAGQAQRRTP